MSQRPFSNSFPRRLNPGSRSSFFREFPLEDEDMFFNSDPTSWDFPSSQLGGSIFDTFPRRSTMRTFPSHHFESGSSGSQDPFASRWHHPSWVEDELRRSRGSSPSPMDRMDSRRSPTPPMPNAAPTGPRSGSGSPGVNSQSFFGRNEFPVKVTHEGVSRTPSRSSTPSSSAGEGNHEASCESPTVPPPGVEKFPGVTSKTHSNAYSARRLPKVHHIPIHVEPRDEGHPSGATPPQSNPEPRARAGSHCDSSSPSSSPRQQRRATHQGQPAKKTAVPRVIPVHMDNSKSQTRPPSTDRLPTPEQRLPTPEQQGRAPSPAPPRKTPPSPFEVIEIVLQAVREMEPRVAAFSGVRTDKEYLFIDEMLTRNLIKLDNIEAEGNSDLRQARKAAIYEVNTIIHALEANVIKPPGEASSESMETGEVRSEESSTVAGSSQGTDAPVAEQFSTVATSQEPMEAETSAPSLTENREDTQPDVEANSEQTGTKEPSAAERSAETTAVDTSKQTAEHVSTNSEQPTTDVPLQSATNEAPMDCNEAPAADDSKKKVVYKTSVELQVSDDSEPNVPNGDATPEEIQAST